MEIRVSDLGQYGIPESILGLWRKRQGERLLPVQSRAVRGGLLGGVPGQSGGNLLVSAPTSAGKSFCAEMAAVKALMQRRKVILLFPLKSLAEEQHRTWSETYGPLGIKSLILTGDHPGNDRRFARGDYHLAIAIYEKLDLALTRRPDLLKNIGLVVVDEVQMIAERGRGALLERLLTRILVSRYEPMLVALSGTLSTEGSRALAGWLRADLIEEHARPRDLIRGVAAGGNLRYRSFNGRTEGCREYATPTEEGTPDTDRRAFIQWLVAQINDGGSPALVFVKSRAETIGLALALAAESSWPSAESALRELVDEEPSVLQRTLRQTLSHGVAFHSSELSSLERRAVEKAFIGGDIRAIVSTTTLSMGVNLPAETVFLETVKYASGEYGDRAELVPISRIEFDNMTGRAGRFRPGTNQPGRAVVLADNAFDQDVLWRQYLLPQAAPCLDSAFASLSLDDWLLSFVAAGLVRSYQELPSLFGCTFAAHLGHEQPGDLAGVVERLVRLGMLRRDGAGFAVTTLGRATARTGLTVAAAGDYVRRLGDGYPGTEFGWLCLALAENTVELPAGLLSSFEYTQNLPTRMLFQRFDHAAEEAAVLLPEDHRRQRPPFRSAAALKGVLVLDEWRRLVPLAELEARYQIHLGQIQSLASATAHLLRAVGTLARALDCQAPQVERLPDLATSVRLGLPEKMLPMAERYGAVLNRHDYRQLREAGLDRCEALQETPNDRLVKTLGGDGKVLKIRKIDESVEREREMQTVQSATAIEPTMGAPVAPQSIEIDGLCEGDRFLIRINGFPVKLTGKSFKYLVKLAWSRLNTKAGWVFKEDIEVGFNQARYLYRMKGEIKAGFATNWPIVENNRLGYYRLSIQPERIRVNTDRLREHPDYEIRSLVAETECPVAVN